MTLESKKVELNKSAEVIYGLLCDYHQLGARFPEGKIEKFRSDENGCSFTVPGTGSVKLRLTDKEPYTSIEYTIETSIIQNMRIIFCIKEITPSKVELSAQLIADIPFFAWTVVKGACLKLLNTIVESIESVDG